ncbi:conserved exported protein of unknown function [Paenibacillus alvei]|uniref:SLH domain-containing protein n=1 Tax=Paenibacillus alvei TaxID=44250 RepID=A0A383RMK3_PAEAL|nr:conserved exported protein of unknown function [Paenibacillus alvei]
MEKLKDNWRTWLSSLLVSGLLFSMAVPAHAAANDAKVSGKPVVVQENKSKVSYTDMSGHWAQQAAIKWSERGVAQGNEGHSFAPNRMVTRAEWAVLLGRMFQPQQGSSSGFTDVAEEKWYAQDIASVVKAGYMKGVDQEHFNPQETLTRQEAAFSLNTILKLTSSADATAWKDNKHIASWAQVAVAAMTEQGLMKGYANGSFQPKQGITRAEAITLLDRAFDAYGTWMDTEGVYGPATGEQQVKGTLFINAAGVTLQNTVIDGDLIIGKHVGEGDVHLNNVKVKGHTYVYGGGDHSIHMDNTIMVNVTLDKRTGGIRLVAQGNSTIQEIVVQSPARIEASKGVDVSKIRLAEQLPAKSEISLNGYFNTVDVEAYSINVHVPEGAIKELNVGKNAEGTTIDATAKADIVSLVMQAATKVVGDAVVQQAIVNAEGVSFHKAPSKLTVGSNVASDVLVSIDGKDKKASEAAVNASDSTGIGTNVNSSNSGSSSSGSNNISSSGNGTGNTGSEEGNSGHGGNGNHDGNGSNNGGSNGGNGSGQGSKITLRDTAVTVGEAVYVTSPREGTAYLVPHKIDLSKLDLVKVAVESGIGKKAEVTAGQPTGIATDGLRFDTYFVAVFDNEGQPIGNSKVTVLEDASKPLMHREFGHHQADESGRESFTFAFNRKIQPASGVSLHSSVLIATYGDVFKPLSPNDEVYIKDNYVFIKPEKAYLGESFDFKLAAGTVETVDTQERNREVAFSGFKHYMKLEVADSASSVIVKAGAPISFKVSRETTVYLVTRNMVGSRDEFERQVQNGWASKRAVGTDEVGRMVQITTQGLAPGKYRLDPFGGNIVTVEITD